MPTGSIHFTEKLDTFTEHGSPQTAGLFNGHTHAETDDFFLVLKGRLEMEMRDHTVALHAGELYVVPRGVEHRTVAEEEPHLLLIEPTGTPNTGNPDTAAAHNLA